MGKLWGREPVVFTALLAALLHAATTFGLHLTAEQNLAVMALAGALLALVARSQVSPVAGGTDSGAGGPYRSKPPPPPPPVDLASRRKGFLWAVAALDSACGLSPLACAASPRDGAVTAVNAAADFGTQAERLLEELDKLEQQSAIGQVPIAELPAKLVEIRGRYHNAFLAYRDFRAAWLASASFVRSYDAAIAVGATPDLTRMLGLVKSLADAEAVFSAAAEQIRSAQ